MNQFPYLFGITFPWSWLLVLGGVGAGILTWVGYRRRANEVKPGRLKILNILRAVCWALLLFCLLQPLKREFVQEKKSSRLTVLIDDSESMSFADKAKGPTRTDRVKAALVGENAVNDVMAGRQTKAADDALLGVLSRSFTLELEGFASSTRDLASAENATVNELLGDLRAQGESSDLTKALNESFSRLKGPDAGGLVLISDGADTARGDLARAAAAYKRAGIPIYVLGVGEPDIEDLSIAQVRCRRTVSKDTLARVEVDVRRMGLPEGKHAVSISRNGRKVGQTVTVDLKSEIGTAVFDFLPEGQGFLEYEATVEPVATELITSNNTMKFGFVAFSRKLRVLYMEGSMYVHEIYNSKSAGMYYSHPMQKWWEHQFLENALLEDLDVEVTVLAKNGEYTQPRGSPRLSLDTVKVGFPKTKKELYQYDVIINSDIPYSYFTEEQIQWTVDFVGKHGGGFIMIGGYDAFGEGKYAKTPIDRMLPVEMQEGDDHVDNISFHWSIPEPALNHPIMQLEKDPEKNKEAWSKLPAFHGFARTTRAKPAAEMLAGVAEEEYETAYGAAIVLAIQRFGNGRSMAFTTDSTGSWGTEWEDTWGPEGETSLTDRNKHFKTFWKNAIRWLAHARTSAPNQLVRIESEKLVYGRGEMPEVRVKVLNEDYEFTHDAKVTLNITRPDGTTQEVTFFPRYEEPGVYERKIELGPVGRYEIEAVATLGKETLGKDQTIFQVQPASEELRQLGQNVKLLQRLADESGGKYLPLEKASELPEYLREATHVIEKHREHDLWDRPWIFAAIILLLCGEWFLRKRNGLP